MKILFRGSALTHPRGRSPGASAQRRRRFTNWIHPLYAMHADRYIAVTSEETDRLVSAVKLRLVIDKVRDFTHLREAYAARREDRRRGVEGPLYNHAEDLGDHVHV